jgi:hypothetical protein
MHNITDLHSCFSCHAMAQRDVVTTVSKKRATCIIGTGGFLS